MDISTKLRREMSALFPASITPSIACKRPNTFLHWTSVQNICWCRWQNVTIITQNSWCLGGLGKFTLMPFVLCNAPVTFDWIMDSILQGLKWQIYLWCLDGLVFSSDFATHIDHLRMILQCLTEANCQLNLKKRRFGTRQLDILDHVVLKDGILPDQVKLLAIEEFPKSTKLKELQSFVDCCS